LYQHGGDRVDNEQLCVVCHNPSSNDKNNRLDRYMIINEDGTVNTDATYDGLPSQTYDMRYMIHSIHGVSKRDAPWVVYRSRGVYFFGTADMELPNGWPEENEEDPGSEPIYGSLNGSTINHNHIVVHYPRPVNFCEACHNEEAYEAVDQAKAVGLTVDAGTDWPDQSDDIVIGPTAAACTACHYSSEVARHATQDFGYGTNVIKDELLEVVY
jgi:OmcA/MtrC family decaheme c-type cytochrome